MTEERTLLYLGHVMSQDGNNLPNIIHKKNKSIGTQKKIVKLVEPLALYTFESAVIYIEALLRSSILYASETMVNLKESEYRALEKIEESVLQKIFQTTRSCSRHLLYLESGMTPARFQVQRQALNLLQYIVQQPTHSLLYKVFEALEKHPTRNDWLTGAKKSLQAFEINLTVQEIKIMKPTKFKNLVKIQASKAAFEYLLDKQAKGKKGKLIQYEKLELADYLLPECSISVKDKIELFAYRCEMNDLPNNFGKSDSCELSCNVLMNNEHLLNCAHLNESNLNNLTLNQLRNGNTIEKVEVLNQLQHNATIRNKYILKQSL